MFLPISLIQKSNQEKTSKTAYILMTGDILFMLDFLSRMEMKRIRFSRRKKKTGRSRPISQVRRMNYAGISDR